MTVPADIYDWIAFIAGTMVIVGGGAATIAWYLRERRVKRERVEDIEREKRQREEDRRAQERAEQKRRDERVADHLRLLREQHAHELKAAADAWLADGVPTFPFEARPRIKFRGDPAVANGSLIDLGERPEPTDWNLFLNHVDNTENYKAASVAHSTLLAEIEKCEEARARVFNMLFQRATAQVRDRFPGVSFVADQKGGSCVYVPVLIEHLRWALFYVIDNPEYQGGKILDPKETARKVVFHLDNHKGSGLAFLQNTVRNREELNAMVSTLYNSPDLREAMRHFEAAKKACEAAFADFTGKAEAVSAKIGRIHRAEGTCGVCEEFPEVARSIIPPEGGVS